MQCSLTIYALLCKYTGIYIYIYVCVHILCLLFYIVPVILMKTKKTTKTYNRIDTYAEEFPVVVLIASNVMLFTSVE